jgi:hypothetical protein
LIGMNGLPSNGLPAADGGLVKLVREFGESIVELIEGEIAIDEVL